METYTSLSKKIGDVIGILCVLESSRYENEKFDGYIPECRLENGFKIYIVSTARVLCFKVLRQRPLME